MFTKSFLKKLINVWDGIRACRMENCQKTIRFCCTFIRDFRVRNLPAFLFLVKGIFRYQMLKIIHTVDCPMVSGALESTTYKTAFVLPGSTTVEKNYMNHTSFKE